MTQKTAIRRFLVSMIAICLTPIIVGAQKASAQLPVAATSSREAFHEYLLSRADSISRETVEYYLKDFLVRYMTDWKPKYYMEKFNRDQQAMNEYFQETFVNSERRDELLVWIYTISNDHRYSYENWIKESCDDLCFNDVEMVARFGYPLALRIIEYSKMRAFEVADTQKYEALSIAMPRVEGNVASLLDLFQTCAQDTTKILIPLFLNDHGELNLDKAYDDSIKKIVKRLDLRLDGPMKRRNPYDASSSSISGEITLEINVIAVPSKQEKQHVKWDKKADRWMYYIYRDGVSIKERHTYYDSDDWVNEALLPMEIDKKKPYTLYYHDTTLTIDCTVTVRYGEDERLNRINRVKVGTASTILPAAAIDSVTPGYY